MHSLQQAELEVLYVDEFLIAVNKPSGLLSVPGRGDLAHDSVTQRAQHRFADTKVVHRLDMATSGILLFARGVNAQRALSRQFEQRKVRKEYVAVVDGLMTDDAGEINAPLIADWPQRPKQKVDFENGKPSITHYQVLARDTSQATTRVALTPVTGRSHQLRVHLSWMGHPILGDALYATPAQIKRAPRLLLHARFIEIEHPSHHEPLALSCEVPF